MSIPVLAVDDDRAVQVSLRVMFRKWDDLELELASDGQEALEMLAQRDFALLITDVQMPKLDGLGLLEAVRKRYPLLPVVMLTGAQDVQTPVRAFRLGALDYLQKPVRAEELRSVIEGAIAPASAPPANAGDVQQLVASLSPEALAAGELDGETRRLLEGLQARVGFTMDILLKRWIANSGVLKDRMYQKRLNDFDA